MFFNGTTQSRTGTSPLHHTTFIPGLTPPGTQQACSLMVITRKPPMTQNTETPTATTVKLVMLTSGITSSQTGRTPLPGPRMDTLTPVPTPPGTQEAWSLMVITRTPPTTQNTVTPTATTNTLDKLSNGTTQSTTGTLINSNMSTEITLDTLIPGLTPPGTHKTCILMA